MCTTAEYLFAGVFAFVRVRCVCFVSVVTACVPYLVGRVAGAPVCVCILVSSCVMCAYGYECLYESVTCTFGVGPFRLVTRPIIRLCSE